MSCLVNQVAAAVNHPLLDPDKHMRLVTTGGRIAAWEREGADRETIVMVISAVMKARSDPSPVRTWSYFDEPIRRAIADKKAMETFDATVSTGPISAGPALQRAMRSRAADAVLAEFDELERPRAATG